jgi:hypothetical protein
VEQPAKGCSQLSATKTTWTGRAISVEAGTSVVLLLAVLPYALYSPRVCFKWCVVMRHVADAA